jgi:hypothetical protein
MPFKLRLGTQETLNKFFGSGNLLIGSLAAPQPSEASSPETPEQPSNVTPISQASEAPPADPEQPE